MGECVCLSVVRETVSTIDLTLLARTDDTEMRVKDSHHKMTTNRNCGLCCQLKGKSIKTEHCCSQCGVTLNPTGCLKQYHSREPDFRLTHALAGLGNANMSRNSGALPKKHSLHCVHLAIKRIVSLSPVYELSFVPSLASKLVSVTELRLFYTSVRKN